MKRLLCCIMALTMIGTATAFAAEPVDNSAIAEKALSEVTALYEDLYTITNAEAEVQNSTYDDMGNIIVDVVVSLTVHSRLPVLRICRISRALRLH